MKETINYLNKKFNNNDTVIVACSGGPDSMCLLDLVNSLKETYNLTVICAHVNHKHREESEYEELKVKEYCSINQITFELLTINDYKNDKFTEDEARDKRYIFFDKLAKKYNANYLMTAHHGDDLIETILMRITRGSNLKGYIGFRKETNNKCYSILRPLIDVTKNDIISYCETNKLWYANDITNESMEHTRNRYRKVITPFLKNEDKNIHKKYIKFSNELNEYESFINKYLNNLETSILFNNIINIENITKEDKFIQRKFIERVITKIQKEDKLYITDKNMEDIINLLNSKSSNKSINLSNGYKAIKNYNNFEIKKIKEENDYSYVFNEELYISKVGSFKKNVDNQEVSNNVIRLSSEDLQLPLIIRTKKDGDKINIKNLNGSKKVKDIFIDEKINIEKRRIYPIVTDSNDIVIWIPGLKKSKFDKKTTEKCDIIIKYEEESNEK